VTWFYGAAYKCTSLLTAALDVTYVFDLFHLLSQNMLSESHIEIIGRYCVSMYCCVLVVFFRLCVVCLNISNRNE